MNPQIARSLFGIALAFIIIFLGFKVRSMLADQKEDAKSRKSQPTIRYVKTQPVSYSDEQVLIEGNGRVVSGNTIEIIPEVQGVILKGDVPLKSGTRFSKGQLILKIDDQEAILNLQASRSQFLTALANILPDVRIDYKDYYPKWLSYYESIDVLTTLPELPFLTGSKEKAFLASRNILNQYYSIKSAEERLSKHKVYAPFSGSISEAYLETGSVVSPGVRIAKIIPNGDLEIEVPVKTDDVKWIKNGVKAKIINSEGVNAWNGYVHRISNNIDPATQSLNVYIKLGAGQEKIYEGMYVNATIPGTTLKSVMKIPRNALFEGNKAYVVDQDGSLRIVNLEVLRKGAKDAYFQGAAEGSNIVVEPMINAYEGLAVKLLTAAE